jgi:hypothetical protein
MTRFPDEREAKEFAVSLIQSEAEREGTPLSELERRMLYFSETGWTIPGMSETAQRFESECDAGRYEKKISALTKRLQTRLRSDDPETLKALLDALQRLSQGDHYLVVLTSGNTSPERPTRDILKLSITALLIVMAGCGLMFLLPDRAASPFDREKSGFFIWLIAAIAGVSFAWLSFIAGREKANEIVDKLVSRIFGETARRR